MDQIAVAGSKILNIMNVGAYWVTAIAGTGQIINCIARRDVQGAIRQAISYGTAFAAIFILQWILDLVKEVFA